MKRRLGFLISISVLFLVFGGNLMSESESVYARPSRVFDQRQMSPGGNRPLLDGDWYWKSSRVREWLHSEDDDPKYTNRGTVTRQTRGFLSDFTNSEINQIAITRRLTPIRHDWSGGLTYNERFGSNNFTANDGLGSMQPYSLRYQGNSGGGDPMVYHKTEDWRSTITHDKVFIPAAWELQRYVESRGWSMARENTEGEGDTNDGYWLSGTQTYTGNISRGVYIDSNGRVRHGAIRSNNRGIVPMLHLKPGASAGEGKRIGDTLTFGRYHSDNPEGHQGDITWRVVNDHEGYKLLMAEHAVDHFQYNVAPGGDPNNAPYAKSDYVWFSSFDFSIVHDLKFANTNERGVHINGAPEQPWFEVLNKDEFYRRNTERAAFEIRGRDVSGRSIRRMWLGGNFVSGEFNRGSESSGAGPVRYWLAKNDAGGRNTVITLQNDQNVFMTGHLPFNMIDSPVNLDVKYDLPYNGYADNNTHVDVDVGLSNWNVSRFIPHFHDRLRGGGLFEVFLPPSHTTYAGTRYRMSGRMRVTHWGELHDALTAAQWNTTGFVHRTYSTILQQPDYLRDMYLSGASYNSGSGLSSNHNHGYDGSNGDVDEAFFMSWADLRDAPGEGWVEFDTLMPVPQTWLSFTGNGLGVHAFPNISTNGFQWPQIEIENWTFELTDDALFRLDWLDLPNGTRVNNPPVGSQTTHRVTNTGNYSFSARDSRGYLWNTTANIKIDKTAPTGSTIISPSTPTNGNVTITLNSRDDETGLASVEYIGGGAVGSQNNPSIDTNDFVQTHSSTFVATQNGTYRFRLTDRVGNVREVTRQVSNIDRSDPLTSVSQNPSSWTNQPVTVNWSAHAQGLSSLRRVRFDDGSGWTGWTNTSGTTQTFQRTVTRNRTVHFQVEDHAGNVATRSHTVENIDTDNPASSVSFSPNAWTNQDVVATIRARDFGSTGYESGLRRLRIRLQGGSWSSWTNYSGETERSTAWFEQTRTITSNGTYERQIEDRAGNIETRTFTVDWIDRALPNVTSSQSPTDWTNGNVTITWSGSSTGSPISRSRTHNGSSWSAWTTHNSASFSRTQSVSSNGTYRIQVQDQAGNNRELTRTINNIDKTAPNMTVSLLDTSWTNDTVRMRTNVTDRGDTGENQHISGVRRIRMRPQGGSWGAWRNFSSSSAQTTNSFNETWDIANNGTYEWQLQDRAGNTRTATGTVSNIDHSTPSGSTNGQTGWTNGNVWIDVTGRDTTSGLASIRYVSGGNITGTTSYSFTGTTSSQTVRFIATENGTYNFDVTDRAGNTRRLTHAVDNIDRTAPNISTTLLDTEWTNDSVRVRTTISDRGDTGQNQHISGVQRIRMRPQGGSWGSWRNLSSSTERQSSNYDETWTIDTVGTYEWQVQDRAGNVRNVTRTITNIDTSLPSGSATHMGDWTNGNVWIDVTGRDTTSGLASIRYVSGGNLTGTTNYSFTGTTSSQTVRFIATENGTYNFDVTDRAGNTRRVTRTVSNIDRTMPSATTSQNPSGWTNQDVTISLNGQDLNNQGTRISGVDRVRMRLAGSSTWTDTRTVSDSTESSPNFGTLNFTVSENGRYQFELRDRAGNIRVVEHTVSTIDRTAPHGSTIQTPTDWTNENITIRLSGGDTNNQGSRIAGVNRVRMRPVGASSWSETRTVSDSTESSPAFNPLNFTITENGRYQFELRDRAGNTRMVEHNVTNIDRLPPTTSGSFTPDGWTNQTIAITWEARRTGSPGAPLESFRYDRGNGDWTSWQPATHATAFNVTQYVTENGVYRFDIRDEAGNVARSSVTVSQHDSVAPVGQIMARYDRSERDDHVDYTSNDLVNMVDSNTVTVDVTNVEDLGISGVEFVTIEEQHRIGYGSEWMTVNETDYDWPHPYNTTSQTYNIDVAHAQDTRFILTVTDRAGNSSSRVASNVVRQSVLQAVDFRITDVVNPQLTEDELDVIRASDLSEGVVELTAGTNVTFDVTYQLRHLDAVDSVSGKIKIQTISDEQTHTHDIDVMERTTGHNQHVTFTQTFTVPQGTPRGSEITIVGNLVAELANGTTHEVTYPNAADFGIIDNHIEEFFRFRIVR